jgi:hypothetical protein
LHGIPTFTNSVVFSEELLSASIRHER